MLKQKGDVANKCHGKTKIMCLWPQNGLFPLNMRPREYRAPYEGGGRVIRRMLRKKSLQLVHHILLM